MADNGTGLAGMKNRVALCACGTYDPDQLDKAIAEAADFAGFPDVAGKRILVKPNILKAAPPEKAVTTHPEFLAAVLRFLRARGAASLAVGDSPAFQGGLGAAKASGLHQAAVEGGAAWVDFVPGRQRPAPGAKLVKSFALAYAVDGCDLVVNLPKLKTHRLMKYTGAIKNLFGLIPNLGKSGMHLRFRDTLSFGTMLVDLALSITPCYTFMDGIVAMEGEGPGDGDPFALGVVLASPSVAALDWIAASCAGYDPRRLPYLVDAIAREGFDPGTPGLEVGPRSLEELAAKDFKLLPYGGSTSAALSAIPAFARPLMTKLLADRPIFHPGRCTGCSACVKICPASALVLGKNARGQHQVRIDDKACITCFCCHEVCPSHAISVGKVLSRKQGERKEP
jgi:uncharacterized protein (DUF362 family)/Pyruvate/2-oxoacid:ferredoxin oxidoreductase delta subunit